MARDWFEFQTGVVAFWMDVAAAQVNAARTIAARTTILLDTTTVVKKRRAARESHSMVAEKIEALSRGAMAGGRVWMTSSSGGRGDPAKLSKIALRATRAAFEPARRRVAANARRLSTSAKTP